MKKTNKKGFTLVEVIVVLVILAILAAIMIPAMTGWIDRANEKTAIVEARTVLLAAQTVASEEYAKGTSDSVIAGNTDAISKLADVGTQASAIASLTVAGGKVTGFSYTASTGKVVTYTSSKGFSIGTGTTTTGGTGNQD